MIEVYCDESRQDLLIRPHSQYDRYALIGSLWIDSETRKVVTRQIRELRIRHEVFGEIKWSKVLSKKKKRFFEELIALFFKHPEVRFRCICIDSYQVDNKRFNEGDGELGFYKFYYQTLYHWICGDTYRIFCDIKVNRNRDRLKDLYRTLSKTTNGVIEFIQPLSSSDTPMLQFCDFLLGLTSSRVNGSVDYGTIKSDLIQAFEYHLGRRIGPTGKMVQKYNIFFIDLKCREDQSE
ncbi:MAG: DUF3800 domain-containing protein [Firmicutes bacterium]|jgi:hypothetical protein|nr:DUF3800 domain-containing protein [Bacillota bacterium]